MNENVKYDNNDKKLQKNPVGYVQPNKKVDIPLYKDTQDPYQEERNIHDSIRKDNPYIYHEYIKRGDLFINRELYKDKDFANIMILNAEKSNSHLEKLAAKFQNLALEEKDYVKRQELEKRHSEYLEQEKEQLFRELNNIEFNMLDQHLHNPKLDYEDSFKKINAEREKLISTFPPEGQAKAREDLEEELKRKQKLSEFHSERRKNNEKKQYYPLDDDVPEEMQKQKSTGFISKIIDVISGKAAKETKEKNKEEYKKINDLFKNGQRGITSKDKTIIEYGEPLRVVAGCNKNGLINRVGPPFDKKPFTLTTSDKDGNVLEAMSFDESGNFLSYKSWDKDGKMSNNPGKVSGFDKKFIESEQKKQLAKNVEEFKKKSMVSSAYQYLNPFVGKKNTKDQEQSR